MSPESVQFPEVASDMPRGAVDTDHWYRSLLNALPDVVFQTDEEGRWTFLNPAWTETTGFAVDESLGRTDLEFLHPDDRALHRRMVAQLLANAGPIAPYSVRVQTREGETRWLEVRLRPEAGNDGARVTGTLHDVTAHVRVQDALRHSQTRLKQLNIIAASVLSGQKVAGLIEGTVSRLATVFPGCRVVYGTVDDDGRSVTRYSRQPDTMPEVSGFMTDLAAAPEYLAALRERKIVSASDVSRDARMTTLAPAMLSRGARSILDVPLQHAGRLVGRLCLEAPLARVWLEDEVTTVREVAETLSVAIAEARTRVEREAAEQALRRSEANLRGLVDNVVFGIFRTTVTGQLLMVNRTLVEMLRYESPDELLAVDTATGLFASAAERAWLMARFASADTVQAEEVVWRRKDGTGITVQLSGRALRFPDGALDGFEVIVEDVTERKVLEEQLRHSQKIEAIGRLTGGIAHDFNNLLTVIQFNAEMVGTALPTERPDLRAKLQALQNAATRGTAMIRKLLAFSRRERLELRPVDLSQLVAELSGVLRRVLPESIEIRSALQPGLPSVRAEPDAIEQILLNLVTNARDAMPQGGALTLETRQVPLDGRGAAALGLAGPGTYVRLAVQDTGIGMDEAVRAKIFEPFFTTKPSGMGTGLGLAMVYGLVKQHSGVIDVLSAANQGTVIAIYFPAAPDEPSAPMIAQPVSDVQGGTETILIAEDEAGVRSAAKDILEWHGYTVLAAADGQEALEVFRQHADRIDLVLSDVVMPHLGGQGLFQTLRHEGHQVRVLFTSGYTARDVGVGTDPSVPFLRKPWLPSDLLARVREVLDSP